MIEVYKYGGNLLKDKQTRIEIYKFLKKKKQQGIKIIMVVSAFGRIGDSFSTDSLSKNIELLTDKEKDQIITFGEIYSSYIIKNELLNEKLNVEALQYDEIGIYCDNNYQNGNIEEIEMLYLKDVIDENDVVIVPGFIAKSKEGKIISLGRNTSDLTGVIIAKYFNLEKVNIIKEVEGVFKIDPKKEESKLLDKVSYDEMNSIILAGSNMFSKKTIDYAKENDVVIEVKGLCKEKGTIISNIPSNEDIVFINKEEDKIKVVFKDMELFNKLFKEIASKKIKLDELVIDKNIIYISGENKEIMDLINENV